MKPPMYHVWTSGGKSDRRRRHSGWIKRVSSGVVFCGASPAGDDFEAMDVDNALAAIQLAPIQARYGKPTTEICPACRDRWVHLGRVRRAIV